MSGCFDSIRAPWWVVSHHVGRPGMWRIKNQTLCLNWRHSIFALSSWEKLRLCKIVTNRFLLRQLRNILEVVRLALINILFKSIDPEASLRMVAPGAGFRGGTLYRPKYRWRAKRKCFRCKTSWFSVRKYVMTKKKGLCLPISGFSVSKQKKPKWCHPKMVTPAPPLATPLNWPLIQSNETVNFIICSILKSQYYWKLSRALSTKAVLNNFFIESRYQRLCLVLFFILTSVLSMNLVLPETLSYAPLLWITEYYKKMTTEMFTLICRNFTFKLSYCYYVWYSF